MSSLGKVDVGSYPLSPGDENLQIARDFLAKDNPEEAERIAYTKLHGVSSSSVFQEIAGYYLAKDNPVEAERVANKIPVVSSSSSSVFQEIAGYYLAKDNPKEAERIAYTKLPTVSSASVFQEIERYYLAKDNPVEAERVAEVKRTVHMKFCELFSSRKP